MTTDMTTLSAALAEHAIELLEANAKVAGTAVQAGDYLIAMGALIDAADMMAQRAYPSDDRKSLKVLQQTLTRMAKVAGRKAGPPR